MRLRVSAAAERSIRHGHPWVYADSVREQNRPGRMGDLAVVYDRQNRFLALGLLDPSSPIRLRVLYQGSPTQVNPAWWADRLARALARRTGLFDEHTNGCRLINGESDGWPGLVLDRYAGTLVLKIYSLIWAPRLEFIGGLVRAQTPSERIVLRLSRNIEEPAREEFHYADGQVIWGEPVSGPQVFLENGLRFEAEVVRGQKTGFFLDQRDNRREVGRLAAGRDVLNAFSFSGGFSLYAARGGAKSVTDLDLSAHALASARRNFALNSSVAAIARCRHECVQADAFEWLEQPRSARFDLVILDPPSLARREAERARALAAYERLARGGISWLRKNGLLVAASCSAHVSAEEFERATARAAQDCGRRWRVLHKTGHAADHPATFPEAHYLKCLFLSFDSRRFRIRRAGKAPPV